MYKLDKLELSITWGRGVTLEGADVTYVSHEEIARQRREHADRMYGNGGYGGGNEPPSSGGPPNIPGFITNLFGGVNASGQNELTRGQDRAIGFFSAGGYRAKIKLQASKGDVGAVHHVKGGPYTKGGKDSKTTAHVDDSFHHHGEHRKGKGEWTGKPTLDKNKKFEKPQLDDLKLRPTRYDSLDLNKK